MSMKSSYAIALAVAALLVVACWFAWHWHTTPVPPALPLERMDPAVAEVIRSGLDDVARTPRSGPAWGKLAMAAAVNGYSESALECLRQAERFDSQDARWPYLQGHLLLSGRPHEALPHLQRALDCATASEQRATIAFRLALALIEDGQLSQAEPCVQVLRAIEPDGPRGHLALGLIAVDRDERAEARHHLESVLASPFARKQAHARLAVLALADGDAASARMYQKRAADLPPDLAWPDPLVAEMHKYAAGRQSRFLEAEGLEAQGRLPEAVALLKQIAAESPDARSYLALGLGLGKLGVYDEAESVLRGVIRMDPQNLQAHHHLGTVLLLAGEQQLQRSGSRERAMALFQQAVDAQDQALAIQRDHGMAQLMRGRALGYLGRSAEAIRALREAALSRPEFADTHLYLGEALAEAGQLDEAIAHLQDAVRLAAPDDSRPRDALAKYQARWR
jgi:tetratricopeptide (TPR) repeat protein